tara:strand:- start:1779 stop:2327 length:549 start_codon:yes stop_codon:yes gene_type:complete
MNFIKNLLRSFQKTSKNIIFCDIDGTINYHYKRIQKFTLPQWPGNKISKKAFDRQEIMKDEPIKESIDAIKELRNYYEIIFLTARNFKNAYSITKDWLDMHDFDYDKIIVVKNPEQKLKYLKKYKNSIFIDDLKRGYHLKETQYYENIIRDLKINNIKFEIFKNNWHEIKKKYIDIAIKKSI